MKTWIKRILIGLVVIIVVAVVGLAIFLLTFDPNAYKYKLAEIIKDRYDRNLTIDGEIELSLFPRIGLSLQDVSLSEAGSTESFASMESARVAVAVFPLLSNNLVVDHVAVSGFKARFVREKDGTFNIDDLVDGPAGKPQVIDSHGVVLAAGAGAGLRVAGTESGSSFQIDIAGLDLQQGEILLQDQMTGRAVALNDLNINTGRVTFNQAFNATLSAHIEGGNPRMDAQLSAQGMLTLDPAARRYAAQKLDLRLTGQLPDVQAKSLVARGNVAFDGRESALDVSALEVLFQGAVSHPAAPMTDVDASVIIPKLSAHPNNSQLQLEKLTVRATGGLKGGPFELAVDAPALNISPSSAAGQALTGRFRVSGATTLDSNFALAGISGNASELDISEAKLEAAIKNGDRLIKTAFVTPLSVDLVQRVFSMSALRGDVAITDPGLPKGSLQIPVIGSVGADLGKDQATANINAVLEGGKFDLSSQISRLSDTPRVDFTLAVDILDLDKLAPPGAAPAAPKTTTTAAGTAAAAPAAPAPDGVVDLSALVGPSATGTIKVGRLVVRGFKAEDVGANIKLERGKLDLGNLTASLYNGKLAGVFSVDAAHNNQLVAKLSLAGIAIDPLLTDTTGRSILSGQGSVVLDVTTAGANTYAMRRALSGTAQARLRDGAIKGINVAKTLRDLKALVYRTRGEQVDPVQAVASATQAIADAAQTVAAQTSPAAPAEAAPAPQVPAPAAPATPAPAPTADTDAGAVAQAAQSVQAVASGDQVSTDSAVQTDFTAFDVDVSFKDGLGTIKALNIASPLLRISQGDPALINLVENTLDIVTLVRVVNTLTGQDGSELADLKNVTVPIHFVGPLEKPLFSVQWKGVAEQVLKQSVQNKVLDAISGKNQDHHDTARDVGNALKGLLRK